MPRKTRMYIPGIPVHVVQRGHNRDATFYCEDDFQFYKTCLSEALKRFKADLHAYCLMTNHVLCGAPHKVCYVNPKIMLSNRELMAFLLINDCSS